MLINCTKRFLRKDKQFVWNQTNELIMDFSNKLRHFESNEPDNLCNNLKKLPPIAILIKSTFKNYMLQTLGYILTKKEISQISYVSSFNFNRNLTEDVIRKFSQSSDNFVSILHFFAQELLKIDKKVIELNFLDFSKAINTILATIRELVKFEDVFFRQHFKSTVFLMHELVEKLVHTHHLVATSIEAETTAELSKAKYTMTVILFYTFEFEMSAMTNDYLKYFEIVDPRLKNFINSARTVDILMLAGYIKGMQHLPYFIWFHYQAKVTAFLNRSFTKAAHLTGESLDEFIKSKLMALGILCSKKLDEETHNEIIHLQSFIKNMIATNSMLLRKNCLIDLFYNIHQLTMENRVYVYSEIFEAVNWGYDFLSSKKNEKEKIETIKKLISGFFIKINLTEEDFVQTCKLFDEYKIMERESIEKKKQSEKESTFINLLFFEFFMSQPFRFNDKIYLQRIDDLLFFIANRFHFLAIVPLRKMIRLINSLRYYCKLTNKTEMIEKINFAMQMIKNNLLSKESNYRSRHLTKFIHEICYEENTLNLKEVTFYKMEKQTKNIVGFKETITFTFDLINASRKEDEEFITQVFSTLLSEINNFGMDGLFEGSDEDDLSVVNIEMSSLANFLMRNDYFQIKGNSIFRRQAEFLQVMIDFIIKINSIGTAKREKNRNNLVFPLLNSSHFQIEYSALMSYKFFAAHSNYSPQVSSELDISMTNLKYLMEDFAEVTKLDTLGNILCELYSFKQNHQKMSDFIDHFVSKLLDHFLKAFGNERDLQEPLSINYVLKFFEIIACFSPRIDRHSHQLEQIAHKYVSNYSQNYQFEALVKWLKILGESGKLDSETVLLIIIEIIRLYNLRILKIINDWNYCDKVHELNELVLQSLIIFQKGEIYKNAKEEQVNTINKFIASLVQENQKFKGLVKLSKGSQLTEVISKYSFSFMNFLNENEIKYKRRVRMFTDYYHYFLPELNVFVVFSWNLNADRKPKFRMALKGIDILGGKLIVIDEEDLNKNPNGEIVFKEFLQSVKDIQKEKLN